MKINELAANFLLIFLDINSPVFKNPKNCCFTHTLLCFTGALCCFTSALVLYTHMFHRCTMELNAKQGFALLCKNVSHFYRDGFETSFEQISSRHIINFPFQSSIMSLVQNAMGKYSSPVSFFLMFFRLLVSLNRYRAF